MASSPHLALLLKIVIGSAWADGHLEPAELDYLHRLLQRYDLEQDPQLKALLNRPVSPDQVEQWMVEYLQGATEEQRMRLLGAIGNLLIADDTVSAEEHQLLDDFHTLMAAIPTQPDLLPKVVKSLGQLFKQIVPRP